MRLRKGCRLWWLVIPVLLLDQVTKHLARGLTRVVNVVPGALSWELAHNRGAAFNVLSGKGWFLIGLGIALMIALVAYLVRHENNALAERVGLWMIVGGGLGNLIDRIIFGSVTDFIRLDFVRFAIFNAADIFVCLGAGLVAVSVFTSELGGKKHG